MMKKCLLTCVVSGVALLGAAERPIGFGAGSAISLASGSGLLMLQAGTKRVWRFDLTTNVWTVAGRAPAVVGPGGAIAVDGLTNCPFALVGGRSTAFFTPALPVNCPEPDTLPATPAPVTAGGALATRLGVAAEQRRGVFATRGGGTGDFWIYDIPLDAWSALPPTPAGVGGGGALVEFASSVSFCSGSQFKVAALRGRNTTDFWCFAIDQNSWEIGPPTPAPVGWGGALAQLQRLGHIYALRGGGTSDFWRFDYPSEVWIPLASTPGPVGAGAGLVGFNFNADVLYALQGGGSPAVWKYDVDTDSWSHVSNVPSP